MHYLPLVPIFLRFISFWDNKKNPKKRTGDEPAVRGFFGKHLLNVFFHIFYHHF